MALEEPESNEGEHDDDVEWHEERFVMMSGKPLGLKISADGEVEDVDEGGQAESLGVSEGAWVVEIGSSDDNAELTAVDTLEEIQSAIASLVLAGESYLTLVTRREVVPDESGGEEAAAKVGSELGDPEEEEKEEELNDNADNDDGDDVDPELEEMYGGMAEYQLEAHPSNEQAPSSPGDDSREWSDNMSKQQPQTNPLLLISVGASVEARFGGDEDWYPGTVMAFHTKKGTVDIDYADGDKEVGVPLSLVRVLGAHQLGLSVSDIEKDDDDDDQQQQQQQQQSPGGGGGGRGAGLSSSSIFTRTVEKQSSKGDNADDDDDDDFYDNADDQGQGSSGAGSGGGDGSALQSSSSSSSNEQGNNEQGAKRAAGQREGPLHFVPDRVAFWRREGDHSSSSSDNGGGKKKEKKVEAGLKDLKQFLNRCGFVGDTDCFEAVVGFGIQRVDELDDQVLVSDVELKSLLHVGDTNDTPATMVAVRKVRRNVHQWLATGDIEDEEGFGAKLNQGLLGGFKRSNSSSSSSSAKAGSGTATIPTFLSSSSSKKGSFGGDSSSNTTKINKNGSGSPTTPKTPTATTKKKSSSSSSSGKESFLERSRQREEERKAHLEAKKKKFEAEQDKEMTGTPKIYSSGKKKNGASGSRSVVVEKGGVGARMHANAERARLAAERRKAIEEAKTAKAGTPKISARGRKANATTWEDNKELADRKAAALKKKQDELFSKTHTSQPKRFTSKAKVSADSGGGMATLYPTKDDRRNAELKIQRKADAMLNKHSFAPKITPKAAKGNLKGTGTPTGGGGYDDDALHKAAHNRLYEADAKARTRKEQRKGEFAREDKEKAMDAVGADGRTVREVLKEQQKRKGKYLSMKEVRDKERQEQEDRERQEYEEQVRQEEAAAEADENSKRQEEARVAAQEKEKAAKLAAEQAAEEAEEASRRARQAERKKGGGGGGVADAKVLAMAKEPQLPPPPVLKSGGGGKNGDNDDDDDDRPRLSLQPSAEEALLMETLGGGGGAGDREGSVPRDNRGSFGLLGSAGIRGSFSLFSKKSGQKERPGGSVERGDKAEMKDENDGDLEPQYRPDAQGTLM